MLLTINKWDFTSDFDWLLAIYNIMKYYLCGFFFQGEFEDSRCRCVCPSVKLFAKKGNLTIDDRQRYYTETNIPAQNW